MNHFASPESQPDPEATPAMKVRTRLLALAASCVVGGLALAAGVALHRAKLEQRSIEDSALTVARAIVGAADREIAAAIARMEALATSPALHTGDLKAFYGQLVATPLPDGTWFVLWNRNRQLLNTLRPFGFSPLPRIADFNAGSQAAIRHAFATRQTLVSPVVWGVAAQTYVIAVTIPIVAYDEVTHLIDTILSDRRIGRVIEEHPLQPGWRGILIDRNRATIAHPRMTERPVGPGVPEAWTGRLRGSEAHGTFFGDRDGAPVLVAFARSPMSDWTAVVEVPWTGAVALVHRTVRLLAAGGAALAIAAIAVALLAARGADRPFQALRTFAAQASTRQREAEERYRTYWQHTGEALFVMSVEDDRFTFEGLNPAHEQLSGLRSFSVAGREPHDCLPSVAAAPLVERCRRCVETGVALRYEESLDLPTGRHDWETSLAPVRDPVSGRVVRLLGSARDVTDRRRAEAALSGLGGRLLTLQDDERRRIARELHDSTAQILVGASFAAARVRTVSSDLTADADDAIEEALSLIEEGQREIRTLAYLLHPPLLDEMGLPAALRWYAKGLARRSGLAVAVEVVPELTGCRMQRDVEAALFRVAQEALGNAHRHSGGSQVQVKLVVAAEGPSGDGPGAVLLAVQDNGRGFAGTQAPPADDDRDPTVFGVGLVGMRERMRQLGGRLVVRPADPGGTVVEAWVPVGVALGPDEVSPRPRHSAVGPA
jgi:PAS domain S-box-containing protein